MGVTLTGGEDGSILCHARDKTKITLKVIARLESHAGKVLVLAVNSDESLLASSDSNAGQSAFESLNQSVARDGHGNECVMMNFALCLR